MRVFRIIVISLLLLLLTFGAGWVSSSVFDRNRVQDADQLTAMVIVDAIQDQYFIVSKTLFLSEEVTVTMRDNSGIKGLLLGDTLHARGLVRVDVGVDVHRLSEPDITVDHENKIIELRIPEATILDSSLFGELAVETDKGLLTNVRDVFGQDDGEEYNQAVRELVRLAEQSTRQRPEIFTDARERSMEFILLIVESLGDEYTIVLK